MNLNSRYSHDDHREMAASSNTNCHHSRTVAAGAGGGSGGRDVVVDQHRSYYSSSTSSGSSSEEEEEEEEEMGDTRRLLDPRIGQREEEDNYPDHHRAMAVAPAAAIYPRLAALQAAENAPLPPPLSVTAAQQQQTQYGSVSSSLPSYARNKTKRKRYRLPFLILLLFDCGLVVFLSIISYDSKKSGLDDPIPKLTYFRMDLKNNFFDLVLLSILRLLLNSLFYILMAWVSRLVMGITTLVSAIYVPLKAYYIYAEDSDIEDIPILLILFVSFVMPWAEAFFFEFKYLPAELARLRLTNTSWKSWEFWLWPRALVRTDLSEPPSLADVATVPQERPNVLAGTYASRQYAASTVSLDFRTPMGSTRNSPVPNHPLYGERSYPATHDDDLPPISEETTPPPGHGEIPVTTRTYSAEDQRFKTEGERVLQQMIEFTADNNNWRLEKKSDGVTYYSRVWQGKKIWKAEGEMDAGADELWNILYPGDEMPLWNPQCTLNETIHRVDEETDVVYSVTSAVGPVTSRDFVSLRQIATRNGCHMSASVATSFSRKPQQPGKVRGENGPCGYKVVPISNNRCLYVWVLNTDLKGWLPQSIIDQTLCGVMSGTFKKLRLFIEDRRPPRVHSN